MTWAQRRKCGQSKMRLANWWHQRKEYPVAVKCYKKALQYYNDIPTNQECSSPEEYKELLQLMEEKGPGNIEIYSQDDELQLIWCIIYPREY